MQKFRKEDLSLHHYIRHNVLNEYIETDTEVPLEYLPDVSTTGSYVYQAQSTRFPPPNSLGRGWVYIDEYGDVTEQQNAVTVYDSVGSVISGSEYMIDYVDGRIVTSGSVTPAAVTYKYFYVSLVNEWQDVEAADVAVAVIDLNAFEKVGFQLGGGKKVPRRGYIHIFATNQAERDDLMELLYDGINDKCVSNQNWTNGSMLDWNGAWNDDYVYELVQYQSNLHVENVRARHVTPPFTMGIPRTDHTMLSDLNRYRARIDFDMFHWREN